MLSAPTRSIRLVVLFAAAFALLALTIAMPRASSALTTIKVPVEGKIVDHPGMSFKGRVVNPNVTYNAEKDILQVAGTLRGTLTKADGTTKSIDEPFKTRAVSSIGSAAAGAVTTQATCPILDLDIGAIHLDLLGLVVNLAPIHLNVDAISGTGALLGNLLCALVGILDTAPSAGLADVLNNLLTLLFGLLGTT
ncbi:MAG TPA: hypothetical protein VFI90_17810 [Rubrobacter sp.]|nr:hypothetical protein [Rubrobacter sp.]